MSEQYEEDQQDEGVKNLRAALKERDKALVEAQARLAEIEAREAANAAAHRATQVKGAFTELGLPAASASLYPADGEVSADAVAEWASTHGLAQSTTTQSSDYSGLNNLMSQTHDMPTSQDDLGNKLLKGVKDSMSRKFRPSDQELSEHQKLIEEVNAANAAYEREILAGRAEPSMAHVNGHGGLVSPPAWANRTLNN